MKFLSILLSVFFIFSVSQKTFACPCQEGKGAGKAPASTTVADAKDAVKDAKAADPKAEKACACEASGKECKCKDCGCGKHKKDDKAHKHKKGDKDCGCEDKKTEA